MMETKRFGVTTMVFVHAADAGAPCSAGLWLASRSPTTLERRLLSS
jgi:hypothetical protein